MQRKIPVCPLKGFSQILSNGAYVNCLSFNENKCFMNSCQVIFYDFFHLLIEVLCIVSTYFNVVSCLVLILL
jgi:hypothetical protein